MKPNFIIFTDGSVRKWYDGKEKTPKNCAAYGVVILNVSTMQYTKFGGELNTSSSAYAEAHAIYRGLQYTNGVCTKKDIDPEVLVITDNKLNVDILTNYIKHSWDLSNWSNWKKADGTPVKNQQTYRHILELIDSGNIMLRIVHMNSHQPLSYVSTLISKLKTDGVNIDEKTARLFVDMNAMADTVASNITRDIKNSKKKHRDKEPEIIWKPVRKVSSN